MKINKNSLQARINNLANEKGVPANVILQDYFFDAFLKRLAASSYVDNFIFKGGFLLSTSLGINYRSTVDIDFLLRKESLTRENIEKIFRNIIKVTVDDNVTFEYQGLEEIRKEDDYGGFNVSLIGHLENIKQPVSVDIATGDPITPSAVIYTHKCLFDDEQLSFKAYNYETIIAEKLETILKRGSTNSRSKDFYDLFIIYKLRWDEININNLKEAFNNTCRYRESIFSKEEALSTLKNITNSGAILTRWVRFWLTHRHWRLSSQRP